MERFIGRCVRGFDSHGQGEAVLIVTVGSYGVYAQTITRGVGVAHAKSKPTHENWTAHEETLGSPQFYPWHKVPTVTLLHEEWRYEQLKD